MSTVATRPLSAAARRQSARLHLSIASRLAHHRFWAGRSVFAHTFVIHIFLYRQHTYVIWGGGTARDVIAHIYKLPKIYNLL